MIIQFDYNAGLTAVSATYTTFLSTAKKVEETQAVIQLKTYLIDKMQAYNTFLGACTGDGWVNWVWMTQPAMFSWFLY